MGHEQLGKENKETFFWKKLFFQKKAKGPLELLIIVAG